MRTHIYAFGSVCRGDILPGSDTDLLALVEGYDPRFDPNTYSIYSYNRLAEIWAEGNPFAWHLSLEARLIYSGDGIDQIKSMGAPGPYRKCVFDCKKFRSLFYEAKFSFLENERSQIFDLSMIFLGIRNIATCYSLGVLSTPDFSRHAALRIGNRSLKIPSEPYEILERCRILCTRGFGPAINHREVEMASSAFPLVEEWMTQLVEEAVHYAA